MSLWDSADLANNNGTLTRTTLTGLGLLFGFEYHAVAALNLFLSKGNDTFFVESTHTGTTNLATGDEFAVLNVFNDVVNIKAVGGITNVALGAGNDQVRVNYLANGYQTFENGIAQPLFLAGGLGDDRYDVGLAGDGSALINIDGGTASEGLNDNLRIYGTDLADTFLFRPHVVASVTVDANRVAQPGAPIERVNYTGTFGGNIRVYGRDGNDTFVFDDTSSPVESSATTATTPSRSVRSSPRRATRRTPTTASARSITSRPRRPRAASSATASASRPRCTAARARTASPSIATSPSCSSSARKTTTRSRCAPSSAVDPNDQKAPRTNINGGQGADFIALHGQLRRCASKAATASTR